MSDRELHLVLPARPENVIVIRQAAAGLGEALGLGPDRVGDLKAAVGEAANNVVLHAYEEGGPLELRAGSDGEELEISVGDRGHGFRPGPGVDEQRSLGLGLPLIAALSDSFTISGSSTGGTRTTMRFALHAAPQPSTNGSATPAQADELAMGITPGSLARPVLARVIGALAARADFSVDRLNDSVLLGDAVSAHTPADFSGGRLEVAITDGDGTLDVRVGPLVAGGGERILSEMNVPEGGSLRTLARSMEVTTERIEGGDVAEYLVFAVGVRPKAAYRSGWATPLWSVTSLCRGMDQRPFPPALTKRADKRARVIVVALALIATTGLRLLVHEPGPLYLLPIGLAGYWFGRWAGLAAGVICTALYMATREIQPGGAHGSIAVALLTRLVAYGGIGFVVGVLAERVTRLRSQVSERDLVLEELREVQAALTPSEPPDRPALELATCYLPAEHGVSGDFHAVVPARDGATLIAVGDVAGRGIEAAKRSWYVRTLLISSADITTDPGTILERANQSLIQESGYGGFVTVACMLFRPDGSLDWALAGHDPPLRLGHGAPLDGNGDSGLPLGVADRLGCVTSTTRLDDGEGALLYTDGLTEARRPSNGSPHPAELFGEQRVMKLAGELGGVPSAEVIDRMRAEVGEFSEGALADDLCLVAVRRSERAGS